MLGRVLALIVKEFFAVWRDKKSRFVLIVPPLIVLKCFDSLRKPNTPPLPVDKYVVTAAMGLVGAIASSAIACWWRRIESGRWAMHVLVASVMLVFYFTAYCFLPT